MNTKIKQNQNNQRQSTRQELGSKKEVQNLSVQHEQEHPETRLTR